MSSIYTFFGQILDRDNMAESLEQAARDVEFLPGYSAALDGRDDVFQGYDEDGDKVVAIRMDDRWWVIYFEPRARRWESRFYGGLDDEGFSQVKENWREYDEVTPAPPATDPEMSTFEGGGQRSSDEGRPRFDMLIVSHLTYEEQIITRAALRMEEGARKYGARNFEKFADQEALERGYASLLRHTMQYVSGDTSEDHAAAVMANLVMLSSVEKKVKE